MDKSALDSKEQKRRVVLNEVLPDRGYMAAQARSNPDNKSKEPASRTANRMMLMMQP